MLEVLDQRLLLTASSAAQTPYWQSILPNQLPDGGVLAKQNSPVILTVDDGLATNSPNSPNKPVYDSRTTGNTILPLSISAPSSGSLYLSPPPEYYDPDDPTEVALDPPINSSYHLVITVSVGGLPGQTVTLANEDGLVDVPLSFLADTSSLVSGQYNYTETVRWQTLSGGTLYDIDGSTQTSFSGTVNIVNHTDDPGTNTYYSDFGSGWNLPGLDRLYIQPGSSTQPTGVALVTGDDQFTWFAGDGCGGPLARDPGPYNFSTLVRNDNGTPSDPSDDTYALTEVNGTVETFNADGLLMKTVDRNGNTLDTYHYIDADGDGIADNISCIKDDLGRTTTFQYADSSKLVTSITDFDGRVTTLSHDASDRITSIADPDPDGTTGPETSPLTQYGYSGSSSLLTSATDPRGLVTTIAYSVVDDVWTITVPQDNIYNPSNNVITIDSAQARLAQLGGSDQEMRNVFGNISYVTRDHFYNVETLQDAAGNDWTYKYTEEAEPGTGDGLLYEIDAPDGLTTNYTYINTTGELQTVYNPDGSEETWEYVDGQVTFDEELGPYAPPGSYLHYTYASNLDSHNNIGTLTQGIDGGDSKVTTYTYTDSTDRASDNPSVGLPIGLVKTMTDADGNVTDYEYNSQGLVSTVTSAIGTANQTSTHYVYDANDNLAAVIDGLGNETDYVYDNLNRLIEVIDPPPTTGASRPTTNYAYDADGNLVATRDPLGNVTRYVYDGLNRQIQVIQPVANPAATPAQATQGANSSSSSNTGTISSSVTLSGGGAGWTASSSSTSVYGTVESTSTSGASATFTFSGSGLDPTKKYVVLVRWVPSTSTTYDSAAQWQVYGNTGAAALTTQTVDLNLAPQGLKDGAGLMWDALGAFSPYVSGSHSLTVTLSDTGGGGLTVDAVRLVEVGPVTQYSYDASGNERSVTDPNGNVTQYQYNGLNQLTQETDPIPAGATLPPITTYKYNSMGWLTSTTDPMDRTTSYLYDELGHQSGTVDPAAPQGLLAQYYLGYEFYLDYPQPIDHTGEDSQIDFSPTSGAFDDYSDLTTSASGFSARWTGAIQIATTDSYTFNLQTDGLCALIIDGQTIINARDTDATVTLTAGQHSIEVDYYHFLASGDASMVLEYAESGGALTPVLSSMLSRDWQTQYDSAGRETRAIDPLGNITSYTYNGLDERTVSTDATGHTTYYTYDDNGNEISETDPDGNTTTWTYNGLNLVATETDQLDNTTSYQYDADGNLIRKIDADGRVTRYAYDNLGRETAETWQQETVAPQVKGRYVFYNDSSFDGNDTGANSNDDNAIAPDKVALLPGDTATSANVTNYVDGINGIMVDILADLPQDGSGNYLISTDSANDFTFKVGNSSDPSTWTTLSGSTLPSVTVRAGAGVDGSDRVTLTWPNGSITNEWLQVTVKANTDTGLSTPDVFYFGNLVGDTNGDFTVNVLDVQNVETNLGETESSPNNPDDIDRDESVDSSDVSIAEANALSGISLAVLAAPATTIQTIGYGYDDDDRLTSATESDGSAAYSYTYDNLGNVTQIYQTLLGLTTPVTFNQQFDANDNRTLLAASIGSSADFTNNYYYNALNLLTEVTQSGPSGGTVTAKRVDFTYNADDQFSTVNRYSSLDTSQLAVTGTYGYDDAGQLTSITYTHAATTLASYSQTYDAAGRVFTASSDDASGIDSVVYTYDAAGQLIASDDQDYSYDPNGNRDADMGYTVDSDNRVTSDGTFNYGYDAEGNLTSKTRTSGSSDDHEVDYGYDYRNRLSSVVFKNNSGTFTKVIHYTYDAFDRLIGRTVYNGSWSITAHDVFVFDGNQMVLRFTGSGYGSSSLGDYSLAERYLWGPAVDMLLADEIAFPYFQMNQWALTDYQNSVRMKVMNTGLTSGTTWYQDFGVPNVSYFGIGYDGRYFDADTGLEWNGERWYSPTLGRFISKDPIFPLSGANPYEYGFNSPTNYTDPSGLGPIPGMEGAPDDDPLEHWPSDILIVPPPPSVTSYTTFPGGTDWNQFPNTSSPNFNVTPQNFITAPIWIYTDPTPPPSFLPDIPGAPPWQIPFMPPGWTIEPTMPTKNTPIHVIIQGPTHQ